jgi:hypothetical protein
MRGIGTVWSLLWRATLFAPVFLLFYIIVVSTWFSRFFLPLPFAITCYTDDWHAASVYAAASIFSFFLWRSPRFRELLEKPPAMM